MFQRKLLLIHVISVLVFGVLPGGISLTCAQQEAPAQKIPTIDGGAGPCSVEFTVVGDQWTPVYAATVDVHFAYGIMGVHKLDLEAGTNIDGKVRFTGLPRKVKEGAMFFRATKGNHSGTVFYNPNTNCTARERIEIFAKH